MAPPIKYHKPGRKKGYTKPDEQTEREKATRKANEGNPHRVKIGRTAQQNSG